MALGDYIQHASDQVGNGTTVNPQLTAAPTSGNLLVLTFCHDSGSTGAIDTPPAGFTQLGFAQSTFNFTGRFWYWYKISDGSEQTNVSIVATAADTLTSRLVEYEWDGSTPVIYTDEDTSKLAVTGSAVSSGSVTNNSPTNIFVYLFGSTHDVNSQDGQATDGTWVEDVQFVGYGGATPDFRIGHLANQLGEQIANHSDTDTGAELWGAIASFSSPLQGPQLLDFWSYGNNTGESPTTGIAYPADVEAGDLFILLIGVDGSTENPVFNNTNGNWLTNQLIAVNSGNDGGPGGHSYGASYHIADGTEDSASITVAFSEGAEQWGGYLIRIRNWHGTTPPELSARGSENGNDTQAVSLNPSWDAANEAPTLWLWFTTSDGDASASNGVVTFPPELPNNRHNGHVSGGTGAPSVSICSDNEAPGTGTFSVALQTDNLGVANPHTEFLIAVRGAGAGAPNITDVDGDEAWTDGDTGLVITGTNFT